MAGAYSAWERAKQAESARTTKPPKDQTAQAMQAPESLPESLKAAEAAASALRAKYRASQAAAEAEERETQRQVDAAKALAARRQQQSEERGRLIEEHLDGNFVPANRAATDQAKIARAAEYAALELGSIAPLLAEAVEELRKFNATTSKRNPKNGRS